MSPGETNVEAIANDARRSVSSNRPRLGLLDERLLALIAAHVADEGTLLAEYQVVADQEPDEYVRYVTKIIVDDEQRHHQLLVEMANYLQAGFGSDMRPRVPWLTKPKRRSQLQSTVARLIAFERRDRRELRRLRRTLRPIRKTSLLSPLVESMLLDTQKHLVLLHAIKP